MVFTKSIEEATTLEMPMLKKHDDSFYSRFY